MPTLRTTDGIELFYIERGEGPETVVFSHSYLADHRHFEAQIDGLAEGYRIIAYDHRDHGQSGHATGPYDIDALVQDAVDVIAHTGAGPCHWVGLSTGGFVGLRLALRHRDLLSSLVAMDTAAGAEPWTKRVEYQGMFLVLRALGVSPLLGSVTGKMFGRSTLANPQLRDVVTIWQERFAKNDPAALIRFGNAIWSRDDVSADLAGLDLPVMVVAGAEDKAIRPAVTARIHQAVPGSQLRSIQAAGHLCTVEQPDAVTQVLRGFIDGLERGEG